VRSVGGPELIIILLVFLLLFGANKLPALAKGLGDGIRNFKKSVSGQEDSAEQKSETQKR